MSRPVTLNEIANLLDMPVKTLRDRIVRLRKQRPDAPFPEPSEKGMYDLYNFDAVVDWMCQCKIEGYKAMQFNRMAQRFIRGEFKPITNKR